MQGPRGHISQAVVNTRIGYTPTIPVGCERKGKTWGWIVFVKQLSKVEVHDKMRSGAMCNQAERHTPRAGRIWRRMALRWRCQ